MVLLTGRVSYYQCAITARKRSCGKVMFSHVSVCHSVQGDPMWPLPMMYWDMGTPPPAPRYQTWVVITGNMGPTSLLLTSGGHHWRPVQTCSLEDQPPLHPSGTGLYWWPPKRVWLASGQYASYWNTVLLNECWNLVRFCVWTNINHFLQRSSKGSFICKGLFKRNVFHPVSVYYRSGTVNSNTVNSKFHLIRSFFKIFARFLSFHA